MTIDLTTRRNHISQTLYLDEPRPDCWCGHREDVHVVGWFPPEVLARVECRTCIVESMAMDLLVMGGGGQGEPS